MTVTFLKTITDKRTQKYRVTSPALLTQHYISLTEQHWLNYVTITDSHQQGAPHQVTSHLNALQRRLYRNGRQ